MVYHVPKTIATTTIYYSHVWDEKAFQINHIQLKIHNKMRTPVLKNVPLSVCTNNFNTYFIVNGKWNDWTKWSKCSTSCGIGSQVRYRVCNEPHYNGSNCPNAAHTNETISCDTNVVCPG